LVFKFESGMTDASLVARTREAGMTATKGTAHPKVPARARTKKPHSFSAARSGALV